MMEYTLREKGNLLSVAGFAESQNSGTRQSLSLPSVALSKDLHWTKSDFAERQKEHDTRQRAALSKGILCRVQHSAKKGTQQNKSNVTAAPAYAVKKYVFAESRHKHSAKTLALPRAGMCTA